MRAVVGRGSHVHKTARRADSRKRSAPRSAHSRGAQALKPKDGSRRVPIRKRAKAREGDRLEGEARSYGMAKKGEAKEQREATPCEGRHRFFGMPTKPDSKSAARRTLGRKGSAFTGAAAHGHRMRQAIERRTKAPKPTSGRTRRKRALSVPPPRFGARATNGGESFRIFTPLGTATH